MTLTLFLKSAQRYVCLASKSAFSSFPYPKAAAYKSPLLPTREPLLPTSQPNLSSIATTSRWYFVFLYYNLQPSTLMAQTSFLRLNPH